MGKVSHVQLLVYDSKEGGIKCMTEEKKGGGVGSGKVENHRRRAMGKCQDESYYTENKSNF